MNKVDYEKEKMRLLSDLDVEIDTFKRRLEYWNRVRVDQCMAALIQLDKDYQLCKDD